jgi:hypothetical protein
MLSYCHNIQETRGMNDIPPLASLLSFLHLAQHNCLLSPSQTILIISTNSVAYSIATTIIAHTAFSIQFILHSFPTYVGIYDTIMSMNTQYIAEQAHIFFTTLVESGIPPYESIMMTQSFTIHLMDMEENKIQIVPGENNEDLSTG